MLEILFGLLFTWHLWNHSKERDVAIRYPAEGTVQSTKHLVHRYMKCQGNFSTFYLQGCFPKAIFDVASVNEGASYRVGH